MKQFLILTLTILSFQISIAQKITKSDLVGEWTFIELQDQNGEKKTSIPLYRSGRDMGVEKVNRDSYILNEDGTYISFNPLDTSYGTWYIDKKTNELNLEMRIDPDFQFLSFMIKEKVVKKRRDGHYYQEPVKKKILKFSQNAMIIADRAKYVLVYQRG